MIKKMIQLQLIIVVLMLFGGFIYAGEVNLKEHLISDNFKSPEFSYPADIDEDGDIDVAVVSRIGGKIVWFDNNGGSPPIFMERSVGISNDARGVFVTDVDGDGDPDLLTTAALGGQEVVWWENDGAIPPNFSKNVIPVNGDDWYPVFATDLDDDGDTDVIVGNGPSGAYANRILWLENNGSSPPSFSERVISTAVNWPYSIFATDLDDDGDIDVLSASRWDDKIAWYENNGGSPPGFSQRVISTNADDAQHVYAADVDADGCIDVLGASAGDDKIAWYKNDGNFPPTFSEQIITVTPGGYGANFAFPTDVDDDGDTDVLATHWLEDKLSWYESDGGILPNFTEQIITNPDCPAPFAKPCFGPKTIYGGYDVDNDGDADVLALMGANDPVEDPGGKLLWYENISISNINNFVTFEPDPSTYYFSPNTAGCQTGSVGKFTFDATLSNISQKKLSNLHVEIDELTNDNLILTGEGLKGEGDIFKIATDKKRDQGRIFSTGGALELETEEWSQSITAGISGQLTEIMIQFHYGVPAKPPALNLSIFDGGNPISGSALFSEQLFITSEDLVDPNLFTWDLSSAGLYFSVGDVLSFVLQADGVGYNIAGNDPPGYAGGELFKNGMPSTELSDIAFITYVVPVPLKTSVVLNPDEFVDVPFTVCLQEKSPFRFFVNVLGIAEDVDLEKGLVASFPFNGNTNDESGNGNAGTVFGTTLTTDRFGQADSAYSFNSAEEDHIVVSDIPGLTATQTKSLWIYPDYPGAIPSYTFVLDEGNSAANFNNNWIELISNRVRAGTDGGHFGDTSRTVDARDWTHIAVTSEIDGDIIVYINAVPEIVATAGTNMPSDIRIGGTMSTFSGDIHFNGKIDDIRFYDRVLSPAEIKALYNLGN